MSITVLAPLTLGQIGKTQLDGDPPHPFEKKETYSK